MGIANIETVRADFFLGHLNDLEVAAADVGGAYLHVFNKGIIYNVAGPKFGEQEGRVIIFMIYIYGMNTFMARWRYALSDKLELLGFRPSK